MGSKAILAAASPGSESVLHNVLQGLSTDAVSSDYV